jgi:FkbM family methyltransferase
MILGTRHLFLRLLDTLSIDLVCDVGSMNGADALAFRRARPRARVVAFEPNPHNLEAMRADTRLPLACIELLPFAASDTDGVAPFHLVDADYRQSHHRRGMSSLHERAEPRLRAGTVPVETRRLDSCLAPPDGGQRRIALWVDVEGKAFEALDGARGLWPEIQLLHVEVETRACIAPGQRLHAEVRRLLEAGRFTELACDRPPSEEQRNAVYVRGDMPRVLQARVAAVARLSRLRHGAISALRRVNPALLARLRRPGGRPCAGC